MLKQPIDEVLQRATGVLIAGAGGGYDILGAVPLLSELRARGIPVHLASLSFTNLRKLPGARRNDACPNLYEVPRDAATPDLYCPEAWLADWLSARIGSPVSIWAFEKTGVQPLLAAYRHLVGEFAIDTVMLLDGGVDLILRGDETSIGTPAEDLCSLAAVSRLDVPNKLAACVGFGAELREGVRHAQVLGRIAELTAENGFLGVSAVTAQTDAGRSYLSAIDHVFSNQEGQRTSHIHTVITRSMRGDFGAVAKHVWLSPLMPIYWQFSLPVVARTHRFLGHLVETNEIGELTLLIEACRKDIGVLQPESIPI